MLLLLLGGAAPTSGSNATPAAATVTVTAHSPTVNLSGVASPVAATVAVTANGATIKPSPSAIGASVTVTAYTASTTNAFSSPHAAAASVTVTGYNATTLTAAASAMATTATVGVVAFNTTNTGSVTATASAAAVAVTANNVSTTTGALAITAFVAVHANTPYVDLPVLGADAERRTVLCSATGATLATLGSGVRHTNVSKRLDIWNGAQFAVPLTDPAVALIGDLQEVQLWRGTTVLIHGPITGRTIAGNYLVCEVSGAPWWLSGRYPGTVNPAELLTNGDFATGTTAGWSFRRTAADQTFEALQPGDVSVVGVGDGVNPPDGKQYSLRLAGDTLADGTGEVFGFQDVTVTAGDRPRRVTLIGFVNIAAGYTRLPALNRGLFLARYDVGYTSLYTDVRGQNQSTISDTHPTGRWIRHDISIDIPPNTTQIVHARVTGLNGTIYWGAVRLVDDEGLEFIEQPAGTIINGVAVDAQTGVDKTDFNLTVTGDLTSGPRRNLVVPFTQQTKSWNLITQFVGVEDGVELRNAYTADQRYLVVGQPHLGALKPGFPLWMPGTVAALDSYSWQGNQAANDVTALGGTVGGGVGLYGRATAPSAFADGQVRQATFSVDPNFARDLDGMARRALAVALRPIAFTVTCHRSLTTAYWAGVEEGDWLPCNIVLGALSIVGDYRVESKTLLESDYIKLVMGGRPVPT